MKKKKGPNSEITLSGQLTIQRAAEVKQVLALAIQTGEPKVVIDLSEATAVDLSFMQILIAAKKTLDSQKRKLMVALPAPEILLTAIESTGCGHSLSPIIG
jgi:anti-sigma B factor antagonist